MVGAMLPLRRLSLFEVQVGSHEITVQSLHVSRTYAGLIEGLPNASMNDRIVRWSIEDGERLVGKPVVLVPPEVVIVPISSHSPNVAETYPRLPSLTCIAELLTYTARDPDRLGSTLTVVWFTNDVTGGALERSLAAAVRGLDWWKHSRDFDW
jgi:hypothetical protein